MCVVQGGGVCFFFICYGQIFVNVVGEFDMDVFGFGLIELGVVQVEVFFDVFVVECFDGIFVL